MNLYLLEQDENSSYDTYDSCVVAAENEEDARSISPTGGWSDNWYNAWASKPENVTVTLIGIADEKIEKGIVLSSFNAG